MFRYKCLVLYFIFFMACPHLVYSQGEIQINPLIRMFYVSNMGNDQWTGSLPAPNSRGDDGPFATLEHARDVIRRLRQISPDNQFTVLVRGGVYRLNETLTFGPEDSGTESNPLIIRAYDKEKPILSGSRPVTNFVTHNGKIFRADLKGTSVEPYVFRQLFAGGKRQTLARFPNYDTRDPIGSGFLYVADSIGGDSKTKFKYSTGSVHSWAEPSNAEIVIYPGPNYWNNIIPIAGIERDQKIITLAGNTSYSIATGDRYFIQNLLEELDSPGEWYFDRMGKILYYWPADDRSLGTVTIPVLKSILEIKGKKYGNKYYGATSYIRIEGFTFEGCESSVIVINGAKKIVIAGSSIYNAGRHGIEIQDGFKNSAVGNDIYDVGGVGIKVTGGDQKTLTPGNNRAENNYIHHVGVFDKNSRGIECRGVGNVIAHNLISSTPRIGILFDGNDHLIEYNHVCHVNQETQDSGAIYSGARDWTKRGNIVRFNYIHDSGGYGRNSAQEPWQSPFYTWGIYLDDWSSGTEVYGNIIADTTRGAIFIHGGRDNIVENNIIIDGGTSGQMVYSAWRPDSPTAQKFLPLMFSKVQEIGYTKYPLLSTITDMATGATMSGNRFVRNIIYYKDKKAPLYGIYNDIDLETTVSDHNVMYHEELPLLVPFMKVPANLQWSVWQDKGFDQHSIIADPLLTDPINGDYTLFPDSPALKIGIKPIPFEKIGLYKDPMRASEPIKK